MAGEPTSASTWTATAGANLLGLQNADGGWPYHAGQASATEPTALAILALSVSGDDLSAEPLNAAAAWLGARQRSDGLFTACPVHEEAGWLTPLAALALHQRGITSASQAAADALLTLPVHTFRPFWTGTYGYDTQIQGWPWTPGDFSFVEPTCLAMVFLKKLGHFATPRVREGARLLRDRALAAGGWNYGEPRVLGGDLFPAIGPTALALLALADEPDETTTAGLNWLLDQRGRISSLLSLGWAAIALNVLGWLDSDWQAAVISRWQELAPERRGPMETSLCLLGLVSGGDHPLGVL